MKNVLIIDDNVLSIQGIYENINWDSIDAQVIDTMSNPMELLKHLGEMDIHIIISDVSMPGINGIEMSKNVISVKPEIKIILISAYDDFDYAKEAIRIGAFDYVEKPIDYSYLSGVIKKAIDQINKEDEIIKQLNQSQSLLIDRFFNNLLNFEPDEAIYFLVPDFKYLGLNASLDVYVCANICINNSVDLKNRLDMRWYKVVLENIVQEIQQRMSFCKMCYCLMKPDRIIAVIGLSSSDNSANEKIFLGLSDVCAIYENQGIDLRIGLGRSVSSIWESSASYQSSIYALQYQFSLEGQKVFDISTINICPLSSAVFSDSNEEKLISLIYKRDRNGLKQFLFDQHEKIYSFSFKKGDIYIYLYSFILKFSKLASSIGIPSQSVEKELADLLQKFDTIQPNEVFEWMYHLCDLACTELEKSLNTYHEQLCQNVNQYISNNYSDNELSLSNIAGYVNLSATYLSTIYKRVTGINIIDAIAEVRMERAKVLLKTTGLPIGNISDMIGFSNQYYFSAFFKKNVGVTPSIFRSSID